MAGRSYQGCPWTTLGIDRNASKDEIREAYRKMALKHHPDTNKGCLNSARRFQQIKDAFEEIQSRPNTTTNYSYRAHTTSPNSRATAGYRYSNASTRTTSDSTFNRFRRDRYPQTDNWTYRDSNFSQKYHQRNVNAETLRALRMRLRVFQSFGVGLGAVIIGTSVAFGVLGVDLAWKKANRGKSFDELMKNLDKQPNQITRVHRRKRMPPQPKQHDDADNDNEHS